MQILSSLSIRHKLRSFFERDRLKFETRAGTGWYPLLAVVLVSLLVAFVLSYRLYSSTMVSLQASPRSDTAERSLSLNLKGLERVLVVYKDREAAFERTLVRPPTFVDPSI